MQKISVFWCRKDFRHLDNPALFSATKYAKENAIELLPLYIIDTDFINNPRWNFGYTYRYYLSSALASFASKFENFCIAIGNPEAIFNELSKQFSLEVFAGNEVEPYNRRRDRLVKKALEKNNSKLHIYPDQTSVDLNTKTGAGNLYTVFTPFRNNVYSNFINPNILPEADLGNIKILSTNFTNIKQLGFSGDKEKLQKNLYDFLDQKWQLSYGENAIINLDEILKRPEYEKFWYTQESQVLENFKAYSKTQLSGYSQNRNLMGQDIAKPLTSRVSVALAWGLVSARTLVKICLEDNNPENENTKSFINELIWREFFRYIMYHNPHGMHLELQEKKRNIMWRSGDQAHELFLKWIKGQTGYKIVDAAMNQIAKEGWMHNRARMIVASILSKNLGIDWRWGQDYFRTILLDLDEASNNGGWQWGASVGADPKPIRIFNPYSQQERFDPDFIYINHYLPKDYNIEEPIVDHKTAREEALARYKLSS
jgi:deoxyribodipyrimidine photo-lyase